MNRISKIGLFLLVAGLLWGCTNPRWIVTDRQAVDREDFEELSSKKFLSRVNPVHPGDPVLELQLLNAKTYRYAEKVRIQRFVQDYKINYLMLSLGVLGAGLSFYSANSSDIINNNTRIKRYALNASGGLFTVLSALSLRPEGDPRPTGEQRFLRQTGSRVDTDTLQVSPTTPDTAEISIFYGDSTLIDQAEQVFRGGLLKINLADPLSQLSITGSDTDSTYLKVAYNDSLYRYRYPLDAILHPYAEVTAPVTELRNDSTRNSENVLAELVEGSQLQIVDEAGSEWYRVLYGISENYILKGDVRKVWKRLGTSDQNRVIAVPTVPFGDIDVESNIPVISGENSDGIALIITNEEYGERLPRRKFANRDARLVETYLKNAFGYRDERIFRLTDVTDPTEVFGTVDRIRSISSPGSELIVYLSGYSTLYRSDSRYLFHLEPAGGIGGEDRGFRLNRLFEQIASIPVDFKLVMGDLDFNHGQQNRQVVESVTPFERPLRELAGILTDQDSRSAVLFGSRLDQSAGLYMIPEGEDKKHHIFPYFVARAIQDRNTTVSEILNYLERNVSYISRKLHDRPQDPVLFGNSSLNIAEQQ